MSILHRIFASGVEEEEDDSLKGRNIAVARAAFRGSTHDKGDVTVNVETQYGDRKNLPITIEASSYSTGNEEFIVNEKRDFDSVPLGWIPMQKSDDFESNSIDRTIHNHSSSFESVNIEENIDRLALVPDTGDRYSESGDEALLHAFEESGWDVAQELVISGSVHKIGYVTVNIDNLIVM